MTALFKRKIKVTLGQVEITNNKIDFEITKTVGEDSNSAVITIYNLNESTRGYIQQLESSKVIVEAGHLGLDPLTGKTLENDDSLFVVFHGDLKQAFQTRQGSDWITRLELGDGHEATSLKRVKLSFKKGTTYKQIALSVLEEAFKETKEEKKVNIGNAVKTLTELTASPTTNGISFSGPGAEALAESLAPLNLKFLIIDNAVYIKETGLSIKAPIPLITKDSGLIGSPEPGKDGTIKFRALIQKGLLPGHKVEIVSSASSIGSLFLIERVDMRGSSYGGNEFTASLECKETT